MSLALGAGFEAPVQTILRNYGLAEDFVTGSSEVVSSCDSSIYVECLEEQPLGIADE